MPIEEIGRNTEMSSCWQVMIWTPLDLWNNLNGDPILTCLEGESKWGLIPPVILSISVFITLGF